MAKLLSIFGHSSHKTLKEMKLRFVTAIACATLLASCQQRNGGGALTTEDSAAIAKAWTEKGPETMMLKSAMAPGGREDVSGMPIDSGDANLMIQTYLENPNAYQAKSIIVHAQSLIDYYQASQASGTPIVNFRFMFAGKNDAGVKKMTFVIAGLDANNRYVLYNGGALPNAVFQHCLPCPTQCPKTGRDGGDSVEISDYVRNVVN